ncbi:hypothetical protein OG871_27615 [Kitasatospora sp. NBC_00374]|uniref:hypothetical protein n=1 Tax=Kitasatospora sp. NBC_00374 TaxID=2975964 RepID=UPI0030E51BC7
MSERPTPDQLDHLLGHAESRRLSPMEAARLRAGVRQLREQAAGAEAWAQHWLHQAASRTTEADRARALHRPQALAGLPTGRCADCQEPTPCPTAQALPVRIRWEETCACHPECPANTPRPTS